MYTGKVKFFNETKGFGFIRADQSGQEIFVHATGLVDKVRENDLVNFDVTQCKENIVSII
jgi:CspA family cold shock protein